MTQRYTAYQPDAELRRSVDAAALVAAGHSAAAAAILADPMAALRLLVEKLGAPQVLPMLEAAAGGNLDGAGVNFHLASS